MYLLVCYFSCYACITYCTYYVTYLIIFKVCTYLYLYIQYQLIMWFLCNHRFISHIEYIKDKTQWMKIREKNNLDGYIIASLAAQAIPHQGASTYYVPSILAIFAPPPSPLSSCVIISKTPHSADVIFQSPSPPHSAYIFSPQHRQYGALFEKNSKHNWNLKC